jgi:hypothetical protein
MKDFIRQIKENYLSIISLFIAVVALIHNNLLYEKSETNRNIRTASFEILMKLGELQQKINTLHFDSTSKDSLIEEWGYIALIGDLSKLVPSPVPQKVEKLIVEWQSHYANVKNSDESLDVISNEIDATREAIITVIKGLN